MSFLMFGPVAKTSDEDYLTFALQEGFDDGYENTVSAVTATGRTHAAQQLWDHGEIADLSIEFKLAAGVSHEIDTPRRLMDVVEQLYKWTIPVSGASAGNKNKKVLRTMKAVVTGTDSYWFERHGVIRNIRHTNHRPWDLASGLPMVVTVRFTLAAHYGAHSQDRVPDSALPSGEKWTFAEVWGQQQEQQ